MALGSGDLAVAAVLDASTLLRPESGHIPTLHPTKEESKAIWHSLIEEVLREQQNEPY